MKPRSNLWGQWKDMGSWYTFHVRSDGFFKFGHWTDRDPYREDLRDEPIHKDKNCNFYLKLIYE